jgi:hypothetical protein
MISLLKILNELEINKPNITQQDCINLMRKLYELTSSIQNTVAGGVTEVWIEYWEKLEYDWSYFDSHKGYTGPRDFIEQNITTPQLCRLFYKDFKEIYDKYSKEDLDELKINNPDPLAKENIINLCKQLLELELMGNVDWEDPDNGLTYYFPEDVLINPNIIKYLEKNKELRFKYKNQTVVFYIGDEGLEFEIL